MNNISKILINDLIYSTGKASAEQIKQHLLLSDEKFFPPLSGRINISEYSIKISQKAITFEAWVDEQLVGLVAVYNNTSEGTLFITNVSIVPDYNGKGIATRLLNNCINWALEKKIDSITLDVNAGNIPAIKFYTKQGFLKMGQNGSIWQMQYKLKN